MVDIKRHDRNTRYIADFYDCNNKSAFYPIKNCNQRLIAKAVNIYYYSGAYDKYYDFDTVDRERIRNIIEIMLDLPPSF